jgi:ERCC4-related helicase
MINLSPREYQKTIFETAKKSNTLAVLPTGLGKTLIALLLSIERKSLFPLSKILFLAPTRPLAEQHFETFKSELPELYAQLDLFTGSVQAPKRRKLFQNSEIIFSTPQCISNDIKSGLYNLEDVSLLIIDEAHRCLKNYSYTHVAQSYKSQAENQLILGLTASPGYEKSKIKEICSHLNIDEIELRTRDSPDVKQYLQELEFEKVEVPFPKEFIEIQTLLKRIYNSCVSKLKEKNLLFGPANKITLLKLQANLARRISQKDFIAIHGISLTAQAIKISHALELLETQTLTGLNDYLHSLIQQANENKSKAVKTLVKSPEFNAALVSLQHLLAKKIQHPKIDELKTLIENEFQTNKDSKIMIFSQFRETASTISKTLNQIPNVKSKVFVGQSKKTNSKSNLTTGLSQKEQKAIIQDFRDNKINVLCATSIGEEGLDIPEVSAVIFYEPIPSAIRKIQRAGRTARLSPGKLLILMTKDTRDIAYHYASRAREKHMHKAIDEIKTELKHQSKNPKLSDFRG